MATYIKDCTILYPLYKVGLIKITEELSVIKIKINIRYYQILWVFGPAWYLRGRGQIDDIDYQRSGQPIENDLADTTNT